MNKTFKTKFLIWQKEKKKPKTSKESKEIEIWKEHFKRIENKIPLSTCRFFKKSHLVRASCKESKTSLLCPTCEP